MDELILKIKDLADTYSANLNSQIEQRKEEMKADDTSHYLIYRVLGISTKEGQLIDEYQNVGRFLYKYAGSLQASAPPPCLQWWIFQSRIRRRRRAPRAARRGRPASRTR